MRRTYLRAAFAAFIVVAIATACRGTGSFTPTAVDQTTALAAVPPAMTAALRSQGLSDDEIIAATQYCTAPVEKLPGIYTSFLSEGLVKGTTFTSSHYSLYAVGKYVKATPGPSSTPTTGPTPSTKPPKPEYFYYGGFTLDKGKGGCAYLVTTVAPKPAKGSKFNAVSVGIPNVQVADSAAKELVHGSMTLKIGSLSAKGGEGPIVLKTSKGGTYATGTVTFVARLTIR
ncbi:MAG TPA: hypothetical protein VMF61_01370 [Candidatus Acidoferrales bacterium]|nr:hypothetical protein [Candidatus Acidoferrales bacterium]